MGVNRISLEQVMTVHTSWSQREKVRKVRNRGPLTEIHEASETTREGSAAVGSFGSSAGYPQK